MKLLAVACVLVALAVAGCGAAAPRAAETPGAVAALLRDKWGSTIGFRSFAYSCRQLDDNEFTCQARDRTGTVRLASFDVICEAARCTWTDYPAYTG